MQSHKLCNQSKLGGVNVETPVRANLQTSLPFRTGGGFAEEVLQRSCVLPTQLCVHQIVFRISSEFNNMLSNIESECCFFYPFEKHLAS